MFLRKCVVTACALSSLMISAGANEFSRGMALSDIESVGMPEIKGLEDGVDGVIYVNGVPHQASTADARLAFPAYRRGVFFSPDLYTANNNFPNNTNRLLPWAFDNAADIISPEYRGLPSNAAPSPVGDAMLLELEDGTYLFVKTVSGDNSLSWLRVNDDGSTGLFVSTLGGDLLPARVPVIIKGHGNDPYSAISDAYDSLIADKEVSSTSRRGQKSMFDAFRYLGWCTWEHYHFDIDESKLIDDMNAIVSSGVPVRYVLIDDGHIQNHGRCLTSLQPDKSKFPSGWKNIHAFRSDSGIRWFGLWYALSGYWDGISPANDFPDSVKSSLYQTDIRLLPGPTRRDIDNYYRFFVTELKNQGFDFLKIDNQSFTLPLYMGGQSSVRRAADCNLALEKATHEAGMGLMNCMAHNAVNTDHTVHSNSTRVSIDYEKYNMNKAKSHLFQSYTNTLLFGQTVWPDHDMFHSCDTICGALMARSKAISGGPVYLSDSPADFVRSNIDPLIDEEGRIFRPEAPAVPMPESVMVNPMASGGPYRVFAPTGNGAMTLICYNLNVPADASAVNEVTACVVPGDYLWRQAFDGKKVNDVPRLIAFDWNEGTARELSDTMEIRLKGFADRMVHLCPVDKGWAVIGIKEKYLSPSTVEIVSISDTEIKVKTLCAGTLCIWADDGDGGALREIPVTALSTVTLKKNE